MVYTQSRVQMLASFELLAVTNLKATGFNSEAGEYTRTSFHRAIHSHALGQICTYTYSVYQSLNVHYMHEQH